MLPKIVAELDPRTPYSPGSPYSYDHFIHPNDERHGTMHIWDVWNQVDYTTYRKYKPRFVSEFGFQGPPAWSTPPWPDCSGRTGQVQGTRPALGWSAS